MMNKKLLILIILFLHNSYSAEPTRALMQNNAMINQKSKTQDRVPKLEDLCIRLIANSMFSEDFLSNYKNAEHKEDQSNIDVSDVDEDVSGIDEYFLNKIKKAMLNNPKIWQYVSVLPLSNKKLQADMISTSFAFSPDGATLASLSLTNIISTWDVKTGQCIKKLQVITHPVESLVLSPDGSTFACPSDYKTIILLDVHTGQCIKKLESLTHEIKSLVFSPDGSTLASASENTIRFWNVKTGHCITKLEGHTDWVLSLAFSPDGSTLASASVDKTIRIWNVKTGQCIQIFTGHTYKVIFVAFSPDGSTLASSSDDRTIRFWEVKTGQCIKTIDGNTDVHSVAFSPDGFILAGKSYGNTFMWNVKTGQCIKQLNGYGCWIKSVAFSPDGSTLASASDNSTICLWKFDKNITPDDLIDSIVELL